MLPSAGWSKAIDAATGYALRWSPEGIVQGIKISPQSTCKWLIGKKWGGFRFDSHHPLQFSATAISPEVAVVVWGRILCKLRGLADRSELLVEAVRDALVCMSGPDGRFFGVEQREITSGTLTASLSASVWKPDQPVLSNSIGEGHAFH